MGAFLNVKINAADVEDRAWLDDILKRAAAIQESATATEQAILELVEQKISAS